MDRYSKYWRAEKKLQTSNKVLLCVLKRFLNITHWPEQKNFYVKFERHQVLSPGPVFVTILHTLKISTQRFEFLKLKLSIVRHVLHKFIGATLKYNKGKCVSFFPILFVIWESAFYSMFVSFGPHINNTSWLLKHS